MILARFAGFILLLFTCSGLLLLGQHQSDYPVIFHWSLFYFVTLCFFSIVNFLQSVFLFRSKFSKASTLFLMSLFVIAFLLPLKVGVFWDPEFYQLRVFVLMSMLLLFLLILNLITKRKEILLTYCVFCFFGLGLFFSEVLIYKPVYVWGDKNTFQYLFPVEAPYTGRGVD